MNRLLIGLILLFIPASALAFDPGLLGATAPLQQKTLIRAQGLLEPRSPSISQTNFNAATPVYRTENDGVGLSARFNWMDLSEPQRNLTDLYDIQVGANFTHKIAEKKLWSVVASFGSASDKPFKDDSVETVSATALYTFPSSDIDGWLFLLNYSNNRPILNNIPLPGFAYIYTPSKEFRGIFGVPFASIFWQFAPKWSLTLFTIAPWVAKAQVAYSIVGPIQAFGGIDFSQNTYLLYGRTDTKERLYFDERKVFVGAKSPLTQFLMAEIESGYAFHRRLFTATSYKVRPPNPTELGSSWYAKLTLSAAF